MQQEGYGFLGSINTIDFTVFDMPVYFFFWVLGLIITISVFVILITIKKYAIKNNLITLFISLISLILFAKLFGCLSGIYRDFGMGISISWESVRTTGIVFYGGLIGLLASYTICNKFTKQDRYILDIVAVCIPLFHSITRVGCFLGGCCFGAKSNTAFSLTYTTTVMGEIVTADRIPIQLVEAFFNICLFVYLLVLFSKEDWKRKGLLRRYLLIYSIGRFVLEFWRGDIVRGVICGVSFSQMISVLIWIYLISTYKKFKSNFEEEIVL